MVYEHYHEELGEECQGIDERIGELQERKAALEHFSELLEKIDCDYGSASVEGRSSPHPNNEGHLRVTCQFIKWHDECMEVLQSDLTDVQYITYNEIDEFFELKVRVPR